MVIWKQVSSDGGGRGSRESKGQEKSEGLQDTTSEARVLPIREKVSSDGGGRGSRERKGQGQGEGLQGTTTQPRVLPVSLPATCTGRGPYTAMSWGQRLSYVLMAKPHHQRLLSLYLNQSRDHRTR